jgi:hypothetical protein
LPTCNYDVEEGWRESTDESMRMHRSERDSNSIKERRSKEDVSNVQVRADLGSSPEEWAVIEEKKVGAKVAALAALVRHQNFKSRIKAGPRRSRIEPRPVMRNPQGRLPGEVREHDAAVRFALRPHGPRGLMLTIRRYKRRRMHQLPSMKDAASFH